MGMYERGVIKKPERREGTHPIWRGIGCIMMVLIAVMSYAGASLLVDANGKHGWVQVPSELRGSLPKIIISGQPVLYVELFVAFILAIVGFGLFVIVYSLVFKTSSPRNKIDY